MVVIASLTRQTDDARLVLRILRTAVAGGGTALNYAHACQLLINRHHRVVGVALTDRAPGQVGRTCELTARVVVNATGAWADELRPADHTQQRHLRPLRGSHLVFPYACLPLTRAVSIWHPRDRRPVFAIPWEELPSWEPQMSIILSLSIKSQAFMHQK